MVEQFPYESELRDDLSRYVISISFSITNISISFITYCCLFPSIIFRLSVHGSGVFGQLNANPDSNIYVWSIKITDLSKHIIVSTKREAL